MVLELLSSNTCYFLWLGKMVGLVMSSRENGRYYFFIWVLNLMSDLIGGGGYGGGGGEVAAGCTEDMAGGQHCVEKRSSGGTTFKEKQTIGCHRFPSDGSCCFLRVCDLLSNNDKGRDLNKYVLVRQTEAPLHTAVRTPAT